MAGRTRGNTQLQSPKVGFGTMRPSHSGAIGTTAPHNFVSTQSISKARKSPCATSKPASRPRSKEASISGSSVNANAVPRANPKKSPGKAYQ